MKIFHEIEAMEQVRKDEIEAARLRVRADMEAAKNEQELAPTVKKFRQAAAPLELAYILAKNHL